MHCFYQCYLVSFYSKILHIKCVQNYQVNSCTRHGTWLGSDIQGFTFQDAGLSQNCQTPYMWKRLLDFMILEVSSNLDALWFTIFQQLKTHLFIWEWGPPLKSQTGSLLIPSLSLMFTMLQEVSIVYGKVVNLILKQFFFQKIIC